MTLNLTSILLGLERPPMRKAIVSQVTFKGASAKPSMAVNRIRSEHDLLGSQKKILEAISARKGVRFHEIVTATGLSDSCVRRRLRDLLLRGMVYFKSKVCPDGYVYKEWFMDQDDD